MSNSKKYENYFKSITDLDLFKSIIHDFEFNEFKIDDELFDELKQMIITDCKNYFNYGDRKYEFSILHNKEINCDINIKTTYKLTTDKHTIQPNYKAIDYKLAKQEMDDILKTDEVLKEVTKFISDKEDNINNNIEKLDLSIFEDSGIYNLSISEKLGIITKDACDECKGAGKIKCSYCDGKGSKICNNCNHTGKTTFEECYKNSKGETKYKTKSQICSNCNGKGTLICDNCNGSRVVKCKACDGLELKFFKLIPVFETNRCVSIGKNKIQSNFKELQKYVDIGNNFTFNKQIKTDNNCMEVENDINFKLRYILVKIKIDDMIEFEQICVIDKENNIAKLSSCAINLLNNISAYSNNQLSYLEQKLSQKEDFVDDDINNITQIRSYFANVKDNYYKDSIDKIINLQTVLLKLNEIVNKENLQDRLNIIKQLNDYFEIYSDNSLVDCFEEYIGYKYGYFGFSKTNNEDDSTIESKIKKQVYLQNLLVKLDKLSQETNYKDSDFSDLSNLQHYITNKTYSIDNIAEKIKKTLKDNNIDNKIKAIVKNMKSKLTGNILGISFFLAIGAILLLAYLVPSFLSSIKPKHDFVFFKANEILQYRHYLFFIVPLFVGLVGAYYRAKKVKRIFYSNLVKATDHTSEFVGEAIGICIFVAILVYIQELIMWIINLF